MPGRAGFNVANFVRYWRQHRPQDSVTVLDALTYAGNRANLAGANSVQFVEADIRDTKLIEALLRDHVRDVDGRTNDIVVLGHNVAQGQTQMEAYGVPGAVQH